MIRIRINDFVQVISGKDRGKRGEVIEIVPKKGKIKIKGVALQTRHMKKRVAHGPEGVKIEEGFVSLSNVMPVCKVTNKPCRVRVKVLEGGVKERMSHRSGEIL